MKQCNTCLRYLDSNCFAPRAASKDGLQPSCMNCANEKVRNWRSKKKQETSNQDQLNIFKEVNK